MKLIFWLALLSVTVPLAAANPTIVKYPKSDVLTTGWDETPSSGAFFSKVDDTGDTSDSVHYGFSGATDHIKWLISGPGAIRDFASSTISLKITHWESTGGCSAFISGQLYNNDSNTLVTSFSVPAHALPTTDTIPLNGGTLVISSNSNWRLELFPACGSGATPANDLTIYSVEIDYDSPLYVYSMVN